MHENDRQPPRPNNQPPRSRQPSHANQPPRAGQSSHANQPPRSRQPSHTNQPPRAGQPSHANQPPRSGQPSHTNQPPRAGQPSHTNQPPRAGQPPHANQPPRRYAKKDSRNIYSDSSRGPGDLHTQPAGRRRKKKKPIVVTAFIVGFILLALSVGTIFANNMLNKIDRKDRNGFKILQSVPEMADDEFVSGSTSDVHLSYASGDVITNPSIRNILLLGCDADDEFGYGRSDSTLLLSIDSKHKKLKLTSFLRDTYLKIPGFEQNNRLNYAYSCGGAGLLTDTIEQNFRVKIDNYVKVDFSSFMDIIDTLGGVDIELTADEAKELNRIYDDSSCRKGVNHLDGGHALNYARIRDLDSDFGRTQRQRNMIQALIAKFKSSGAPKMIEVLNATLPMIQTDMSNDDLIGWATKSPTIMQYPISQLTVPQSDTCEDTVIRNMQVLVPDVEANKNAIWQFIYE